jgi:DNA-binding NtrC family response regulator
VPGPTIEIDDVRSELQPRAGREPDLLGRPLGEGLDLPALMGELASHYLHRALEEAGGNKTRAAELVGLRSYQTLTNWLNKYRVREPKRGRRR